MLSIWRKKDVLTLQREAETGTYLKCSLGVLSLTALGIGAIIGVGVFVLTGVAAATQAGPAVALSFVIAGIASASAASCYAEFASMIPVAGSAYTYGYAVLGEIFAWIIGWDLLIEYSLRSWPGWSTLEPSRPSSSFAPRLLSCARPAQS
jgi:basic amino acid/polyamine antiporter, APA family